MYQDSDSRVLINSIVNSRWKVRNNKVGVRCHTDQIPRWSLQYSSNPLTFVCRLLESCEYASTRLYIFPESESKPHQLTMKAHHFSLTYIWSMLRPTLRTEHPNRVKRPPYEKCGHYLLSSMPVGPILASLGWLELFKYSCSRRDTLFQRQAYCLSALRA